MTLTDRYKRFIENYRTENGGINLYPQFDQDLDLLLDYLEEDYNLNAMDVYVDCSWRPAEEVCNGHGED